LQEFGILFPKIPDNHKPNKPLVPNGLGVIYVLASATYLFVLYYFQLAYNNFSPALTLAVCILFGGFMGLLDDWMDLPWRYKAFFPLAAAVPLISLATSLGLRTSITVPILGIIDFGMYYFFVIIPLIVTITTNTVNQLGGLNGLETICPAIVMIGLMASSLMAGSGSNAILLYVPLIVWLLLAFFNFQGKIFVGNTGSFAIGITLASFAIISDTKTVLLISILPYIFNSSLVLLNYFFFRTKADVSFDGKKLFSDHRRSLVTLITHRRYLAERKVVVIISLLMAASTSAALFVQWLLL
jgi:UDP-N-acetylmuramyl pentapeptide phosphotransferase/UDP-N-acetylglucosamine-1-phosphate transferase